MLPPKCYTAYAGDWSKFEIENDIKVLVVLDDLLLLFRDNIDNKMYTCHYAHTSKGVNFVEYEEQQPYSTKARL